MRAALYLRQSLDRDGTELAIQRQREQCLNLADSRGYEVVETIEDNNRSASRGERPGYQHLLELIEARTVDVVVVLRVDRLLRRLTDLEALIDLSERSGVQIVTVDGDLDLSSSSGRLIARILASVARGEVETKSARQRLANEQRARAGKPYITTRLYGYEADLVTVRQSEAEVLREMARRLMSGHSYREIARWANGEGHVTPRGGRWEGRGVKRLIERKHYAGIRDYHGSEYPGSWEPIFDPITWQRLQAANDLHLEATAQYAAKSRKYLLTGFVVCGRCGQALTGQVRQTGREGWGRRRTYLCRGANTNNPQGGCGRIRRNAEALDHWVRNAVITRLDSAVLSKQLGNEEDESELAFRLDQRQQIQARLDGLVDDYATGLLTAKELARAKQTAEAELHDLQVRIQALSRAHKALGVPSGESLQEAWGRETDGWRRRVVGLVVKSITVNPDMGSKPVYEINGVKHRFDPRTIEIEWVA